MIGADVYGILKDLVAPDRPVEKSYTELVRTLQQHFSPPTLTLAERFKFGIRNQKPGESYAEFATALRRLTAKCEFGTFLDDALCLRFVCGLQDKATQKRLLLLKEPKFKDVLDTAIKCESADHHMELMQDKSPDSGVFQFKKNNFANNSQKFKNQSLSKQCWRCERRNHHEKDCYFKQTMCKKCQQIGHIARACKNKSKFQGRRQGNVRAVSSNVEQQHGNPEEDVQVNNHNNNIDRNSLHTNDKHYNITLPSKWLHEKQLSSTDDRDTLNYNNLNNMATRGICNIATNGCNYLSNSSSKDSSVITVDKNVNNCILNGSDSIFVTPKVNGRPIKMELDTGSSVSIMNVSDYHKFFPGEHRRLRRSAVVLKTYTGQQIKPVGVTWVNVSMNNCDEKCVRLYVVETGANPLFGRSWLKTFYGNNVFHIINGNNTVNKHAVELPAVMKVPTKSVLSHTNSVSTESNVINQLLNDFHCLFDGKLGLLNGVKGKLYIDEGMKPIFCKARPLPFTLEQPVSREIDRLVKMGVAYFVPWSDWATPVVPVLKKNGEVRLCGDFKVTLNKGLKVEQYPLPKIDEIFAKLGDGKYFSKLDLTTAYLQMEMDDEAQKLLTLNTHKGLLRFTRLLYGVASAPGVWQKHMDQILRDLPGVQCILDDILVTGATKQEHLVNLKNVLNKLKHAGLTLNLKKCTFFQTKVEYCGHVIDGAGLHTAPGKIEAMMSCPIPQNVTQLKSFLGLINYYHKFLPNLSSILFPLHQLLKNDRKWEWDQKCQKSFEEVKRLLASKNVLVHYDPNLPVRLASDASAYGIGAVLSHVMPDGSEKPIAYGSKSLSKCQEKYSQIDKEALALIWAVKKFHYFLMGKKFTLITDHKPLVHIFSPDKGIPVMSAARLQRYAILLSAYQYNIEYRNTNDHANADCFSRLPIKDTVPFENDIDYANFFYINQFDALPISALTVSKETHKDKILGRVLACVKTGRWPKDEKLKPYYQKRGELSVYQGCVVWGPRVLIPHNLQNQILQLLHEGHLGIVKMKQIARSLVWWPKIDKSLEMLTAQCTGCLSVRNAPPKVQIHPWEPSHNPWDRIHLDFASNKMGKFLVCVDAFSKWPEVIPMTSTAAPQLVKVMKTLFARWGLPKKVISDNGPEFISDEFESFLTQNGVSHRTSPVGHPASNGLAERHVQNVKKSLKKWRMNQGPYGISWQNFCWHIGVHHTH